MAVVLLPGWGVLILMVWFVPVGVVTARSIKPSPFRGHIAWDRIARVTERRRRGGASVQLVLKDGGTVSCRIPVSEMGELRRLAEHAGATGDEMPLTQPPPQPQERLAPAAGNRLSTFAFIYGGIAVLFLPIVLGPIAIVCAGLATRRRESHARVAMASAVTCTIFGFMGGAVWLHLRGA